MELDLQPISREQLAETFEDAPEELPEVGVAEADGQPVDLDGSLLRGQLKEITLILKMALNNEFARALELCAGR